jgi:hypothetical protein
MKQKNSTAERTPGSLHPACSTAGVGTAHISAAEIKVPIKSNRLKLLWASICPWKRDIQISVKAAGIFIAAPPQ